MGSISSSIYSRKLAAKADEKYVATQQQWPSLRLGESKSSKAATQKRLYVHYNVRVQSAREWTASLLPFYPLTTVLLIYSPSQPFTIQPFYPFSAGVVPQLSLGQDS